MYLFFYIYPSTIQQMDVAMQGELSKSKDTISKLESELVSLNIPSTRVRIFLIHDAGRDARCAISQEAAL